jgi:hypothetical protein
VSFAKEISLDTPDNTHINDHQIWNVENKKITKYCSKQELAGK